MTRLDRIMEAARLRDEAAKKVEAAVEEAKTAKEMLKRAQRQLDVALAKAQQLELFEDDGDVRRDETGH